jgi:hypothetical protein
VNEAGDAVFAEHLEFDQDRLLYGIQFDIDSARIVGIALHKQTGRTEVDEDASFYYWTYKLGIITIAIPQTNQVELKFIEKDLVDLDAQPLSNKGYFDVSKTSLVFTGEDNYYYLTKILQVDDIRVCSTLFFPFPAASPVAVLTLRLLIINAPKANA